MKQILVIAEVFNGRVKPVTRELAAAALDIKIKQNLQQISSDIHIIVPSDDPAAEAKKIAEQTGMDVTGLKIPGLKAYASEVYLYCLDRVIRTMNPSHVLAAHTSQGRDFAPGLALGLNAASISGVNCIQSHGDDLVYSRSVFDNTQNMVIRPTPDKPVVLTLLPGVFKPAPEKPEKSGRVDIQEIVFTPGSRGKGRIRHRRILKKPCENQALKGAKTIVAAGRGMKKKENLEFIFKFAECFSSSAVGASRPLVDMGWIGYEHQVGVTGAVVAPELYIACGISGSSQHLAGMKDAKLVVSINKNPAAPLFSHSDLCITEDILEFIPAFLKKTEAGESSA
ncbi:MAG: electron transfer flavoprotein subunit alpha/FixB family protein [Deltaproteobacteria bacterium]|nr:electron transfer flavoprotein subunit alpha/FixB family protein [Deltaproteobacteria bacterium]